MSEQDHRDTKRSHLGELVFDIVEKPAERLDMAFGPFGGSMASLVDADRANARASELRPDLFVTSRMLGDAVDEQHQRARWSIGQPLATRLPITFSVNPVVDQARSTHGQSIGT